MCLYLPPPENVEKIVHNRKWLVAKKGYLLKPIVAVPGDSVCIENSHFYVNNFDFGEVKSQDREGRWLPDYHFCGTVKPGTFFVGVQAENSFDSRYFGPIKTTQILGVAKTFLTLPLLEKRLKNCLNPSGRVIAAWISIDIRICRNGNGTESTFLAIVIY
jgi:conjugative transfer signal peptidase TraF